MLGACFGLALVGLAYLAAEIDWQLDLVEVVATTVTCGLQGHIKTMSTNSREKEGEQEEALLENPERQQAILANANVIVNPLESNNDSNTDHANNTNRSGRCSGF